VRTVSFLAIAALLAGCASVSTVDGSRCVSHSSSEEVVEGVQVFNSGWKLFSCIPLASGDPKNPNLPTCHFFTNTVTLQNQVEMLEAEARRVGARKADNVITSYSSERVLLFLLLREKIITSAMLVK
jgi:hypothetical protein